MISASSIVVRLRRQDDVQQTTDDREAKGPEDDLVLLRQAERFRQRHSYRLIGVRQRRKAFQAVLTARLDTRATRWTNNDIRTTTAPRATTRFS